MIEYVPGISAVSRWPHLQPGKKALTEMIPADSLDTAGSEVLRAAAY